MLSFSILRKAAAGFLFRAGKVSPDGPVLTTKRISGFNGEN
jgi:hypothetical protein